jgi:hypothetical protein
VGATIARWCAKQLKSFGTIKDPDHEEVRKALDISEPEFKFRFYFKNALRVVLRA